jgi:hypothetical protein
MATAVSSTDAKDIPSRAGTNSSILSEDAVPEVDPTGVRLRPRLPRRSLPRMN